VVGNDVSLAIEQVLHSEFRLPELAPARLLEQVVEAGYLGRKTRSAVSAPTDHRGRAAECDDDAPDAGRVLRSGRLSGCETTTSRHSR
jgi:3-hydroxyacyl-CoA dehydrogenase